jgi:hypothetical protein
MNRLILLLFTTFCCVPLANSADIYVAASSAGGANGTSCGNAYAWSKWADPSIWIGDNTLHICGTYTGSANSTAIASRGAGTSGHPITIKFEPGARLEAPYWNNPNGAIYSSHAYVTIDGGGNGTTGAQGAGTGGGTIAATLNGEIGANCLGGPCTQKADGQGVLLAGDHKSSPICTFRSRTPTARPSVTQTPRY